MFYKIYIFCNSPYIALKERIPESTNCYAKVPQKQCVFNRGRGAVVQDVTSWRHRSATLLTLSMTVCTCIFFLRVINNAGS